MKINENLKLFIRSALLVGLFAMQSICAAESKQQLSILADHYLAATLELSQPSAYFSGIELKRHDKFLDNSEAGLTSFRKTEDDLLISLQQMNVDLIKDAKQRVFYAKFVEAVEASVEQRICKSELWNVNHMFNALTTLDFLIKVQPVSNEVERQDAILRWLNAVDYYKQEIVNLMEGLKQGYSAPKRVVQRVIDQHVAVTKIGIEDHPFLGLAKRSKDKVFSNQFKKLVQHQLLPAIKRYNHFLQNVYLVKAREPLGIHAIPNGRECYMAQYRGYTSLKRTPQQVFDLGLEAVNKNKAKVIEFGKKAYRANNFVQAVKLAKQDKQEKFADGKIMHNYFLGVVERAKQKMPEYFKSMPSIEMEVEAIPQYQQGTGRSAHYVRGTKNRTAKFGYDPTTFESENFGTAEIVSVHEGYPGHHMQIALVQGQENFHPIEASFGNSAFSEGWARYAEALSEEAGIYQSRSAKILRRAWPARGMVADTAMHLLGWSNQKVADFLVESGASFAEDPSVVMDRMAAIPAQLTSYDSGALEIFALRALMEKEQGKRFDIKEFHQLILMNGNVPMAVLREQVESVLK